MNEVYTIWVGEYSDADVIGVAYDKKIANAYAKLHNGYVSTAPLITDQNFIALADEMIIENIIGFFVKANYKGWERISIITHLIEPNSKKEELYESKVDYGSGHYIDFYIYGEYTEDELDKIGFDKIVKYVAEKRGL